MHEILCPTRGGEASIPNQLRAIELARQRGVDLIFLYISDVHFLDHVASPVSVELVEQQLDEIGDFVLAMACERARKAGVQARAEVRRGEFRAALGDVIREFGVSAVLLGAGSQGTGVTTPEYRQDLATFLVKNYGVEVLISAEGEIVAHHKPGD